MMHCKPVQPGTFHGQTQTSNFEGRDHSPFVEMAKKNLLSPGASRNTQNIPAGEKKYPGSEGRFGRY